MSAEEDTQGGLGKSIVLVILGLFVLYYGIKVMQDQDGHGQNSEHHVEDSQTTNMDEHVVDTSIPSPVNSISKPVSTVDLNALKNENARLKREVTDLQTKLYESNQKLGAVRKLLEGEAATSQE